MNVDYGGREPVTFIAIIGIIGFILLFIVIIYQLNKRTGNSNDKIENALDLVEKFKEVHDIGNDYWFAYYYHVKNVIEYGTGVNPNPNFEFYDKQHFTISYKQYCEQAYFFAVANGVVLKSERWADFDVDRKTKVIREVMGYCPALKGRIDLHFTGKLKDWGTDTYEVIWGIVEDFAGL